MADPVSQHRAKALNSSLGPATRSRPGKAPSGTGDAGHVPATGLHALQRLAGESPVVSRLASLGVLQRKIIWDAAAAAWDCDGRRPGWRAYLKRHVENVGGFATGANLATQGADRVHRIPFEAIQHLIVDYLNGDATDKELKDLTDSLFDIGSDEHDAMVSARDDLVNGKGGSTHFVKVFANALLSRLNSATENVGAGDAPENRGIGARSDYRYAQSPGGTSWNLTPRSGELHATWGAYGREPDPAMTPGGVHVRSSHFSGAQQGGDDVAMSDVSGW